MNDKVESHYDSELLEYIDSRADSYYSLSETIARRLMIELVKAGYASFLLLKDDDINAWWASVVRKSQDEITAYKEKVRLYEIKYAAWERLSEEDRKILKIRKPTKPKELVKNKK